MKKGWGRKRFHGLTFRDGKMKKCSSEVTLILKETIIHLEVLFKV